MGKYDVIDRRYRQGPEVVADLMGAELHEICEHFPPAVQDSAWEDAAFARRFRSALPQLPPPDSAMIAFLCAVFDLEIDHEVEEIDRLIRAGADRACCPSAAHVETLHFLWRMLLLQLEERCSQVHGFRREDKHRVVQSLRLRASRVLLA